MLFHVGAARRQHERLHCHRAVQARRARRAVPHWASERRPWQRVQDTPRDHSGRLQFFVFNMLRLCSLLQCDRSSGHIATKLWSLSAPDIAVHSTVYTLRAVVARLALKRSPRNNSADSGTQSASDTSLDSACAWYICFADRISSDT